MSQPVSDATDALPELHGGRHVGPHGGRHIQRQARGRGGDDTTHEAPAQVRQTRKDGWSAQRQAQFLEALEDSFNVAQAARDVGMSVQSAYKLRQRDPGFAQGWAEALERGYAELEMLLLRQALYGTEQVETIDPGDGGPQRVKRVTHYPHGMAIRLLFAHHASVAAVRAARGGERPDVEGLRTEIQRRIAQMKARTKKNKGGAGE